MNRLAAPLVLVAEDDRAVRESLLRALSLEGYEVCSAADGEEALTVAAERNPHVIVLDVLMPVLDGLSVCRRLRALGDATPILLLTARSAVPDRVSGLDAGAQDRLSHMP